MDSINWLTPEFTGISNTLGYSHHNRKMREHVSKLMDINDRKSPYCFQIMSADNYTNIPGKINIAFTMWEFIDVPEAYKKVCDIADYIIVPCQFCKDIFQPYTKGKIFVCGEGIEPEDYPFYQRREPDYSAGERFRVYWAGAPNPRKGYPYMMELIKFVANRSDMEVYLKTTMKKMTVEEKRAQAQAKIDTGKFSGKALEKLKEIANGGSLKDWERYFKTDALMTYGKHKNIFFDTRFLPYEELRELYNKAHVFAFPTAGEGWGLMGNEAMATGCPMIAPIHTGLRDYFDATVGYPIGYDITVRDCTIYGMKSQTYNPYVDEFVQKVFEVKNNYREALERGKRASKRIHSKHTWAIKAQVLKSILDKIEKIEQNREPITVKPYRPVLSICVPTYNMAYYLSALLHGMVREITNNNNHLIELCISDNASEDDTEKVVKTFIENTNVNVKYHRFETNQGFENNISNAASMASGKYIWFFGADDDIVRGSIDKMLENIKSESDMYVCNRVELDYKMAAFNRRSWRGDCPTQTFDLETQKIGYIKECTSIGGLFSYIGSLCIKRELWDAIPFKDEWRGYEYIHTFKAFQIFMTAKKLTYIKDQYVYCKVQNIEPVLNEKTGEGMTSLERILLDLEAYEEILKIADDEVFDACCKVIQRERPIQQLNMYIESEKIQYYIKHFKY